MCNFGGAVHSELDNSGGTYDIVGGHRKEILTLVGLIEDFLAEGDQDIAEVGSMLRVDDVVKALTANVRHLVGYFGSEMPNSIRIQVGILGEIEDASVSLETAIADWRRVSNE